MTLVRELFVHAPVTRPLIGEDLAALLDVLTHDRLHDLLGSVFNDCGANRTATLKHSHHNSLAASVAAFLLVAGFAVRVHVTRLPADEGFVYLNLSAFTTQLVERLALHRKANSVKHEPRGLLSHADRAVKLPGRDTVLAVQNHPDSRQPLLKPYRRVFKDGSRLERKARLGVRGVALPYAVLCPV